MKRKEKGVSTTAVPVATTGKAPNCGAAFSPRWGWIIKALIGPCIAAVLVVVLPRLIYPPARQLDIFARNEPLPKGHRSVVPGSSRLSSALIAYGESPVELLPYANSTGCLRVALKDKLLSYVEFYYFEYEDDPLIEHVVFGLRNDMGNFEEAAREAFGEENLRETVFRCLVWEIGGLKVMLRPKEHKLEIEAI